MTKPEIAEIIDPKPDLQPAYDAARDTFKSLYPALKGVS